MAKNDITLSALVSAFAALVLAGLSGTPLYVSFFALFLEPVSKDLGWSLAVFPRGLLAFSVTFAIAAPLAGWLSDRLGVRATLIAGVALTTAGLLGVSLMSGALAPLIGCSFLIGVGSALVGVTSLASSVAGHFEKGRGLAMGIVFGAGPMLAAAAFSPIVSSSIAALGWRSAYQGLAIIGGVVSFVMVLALRKPPLANAGVPGMPMGRNPEAGDDLRMALRRRSFWLIFAASMLLPIVFGGVSGHIVAIAAENGLPASIGAAMLSTAFLSGVFGPIVAGAAIDWLGRPQALLPFVAAPLIGLLLLLTKGSVPAYIAGSALIGLGFSAWSGQTALLITRYFGLRATGAIVGIIFATGGVFLGLGPVIVGFLRTTTGNYQSALWLSIGLQAVALLFVALLGPFWIKATGRELVDRPVEPAVVANTFN